MHRTKTFLTLVVVGFCLALIGCGFGGTYEAPGGEMSITFNSGKATMTMAGKSEVFDYDVKGDKILVHTKLLGDMEFIRNSDGSLQSGAGVLKKK